MSRTFGNNRKVKRIRYGPMTNKPMGNPQALISPNEFDTRLSFVDSVGLSSLGAFANYNFNPNCPYDVDPAFGSTSTAGFAELAALYQFQRTIAYKYRVQFANNTGGFLQATVINTNVTPPNAAYYSIAGNQYSQTQMMGPSPMDKAIVSFRGNHTIAQIVGSLTPETADSFASVTNTVPTDKIWLGLSITDLAGSAVTSVIVTIQIEMMIRFFERKNLSS